MGEKFVDGADGEPLHQESGAGLDGTSPLEVALYWALGLFACAVLALSLFRSDSGPPRRDVPVGASLLPVSSCRTDDVGTVTCADPVSGVDTVQIRTYPSRRDLYAAYVRDVEAVTGRSFEGNVGDCSGSRYEGELSWSLDGARSRGFPLRQLRDGQADPITEAAGRVFCTSSGGKTAVIWTQDPSRLLMATGGPPEKVGRWWVEAHLDLACADESADCPR